MDETERLRRKLSVIFNSGPGSPYTPTGRADPHDAIEAAKDNGMEIVLAHPTGHLLLMDPYSATHYEYAPYGPLGKYQPKEQVEDIVVGQPVPPRFTRSKWRPVDPDWRARVSNGSVEAGT